jgi:chemotaxis protein methyltransferase CheR
MDALRNRNAASSEFTLEGISDRAFEQLKKLIQQESGIHLSDGKRELLCSRLGKRLRYLGLASYDEYYHHLLCGDLDGIELQQLINCISTTKTEFFRENHHFEFLRDQVFPEWRSTAARDGDRKIRLWSAACSGGQEPYSLAITLLEHFPLIAAWDIRILATDINTNVLEAAQRGIYPLAETDAIAQDVRDRWFMKGTGRQRGMCRVCADARRFLTFASLNLNATPWPMHGRFDAIFCRNVLIYFDEATRCQLMERFAERLNPAAYLFLGHSENLPATNTGFEHVGHTIYRKRE